MHVLLSTRVGRGYRITVHREVRRLLELGEKGALEWVFENGRIYVRKKGDSSG